MPPVGRPGEGHNPLLVDLPSGEDTRENRGKGKNPKKPRPKNKHASLILGSDRVTVAT